MSDQKRNPSNSIDDLFENLSSEEENESLSVEVEYQAAKSRTIIQSVEEYFGTKEVFFRNYFDLEGTGFPDLFTREYKDSSGEKRKKSKQKTSPADDCDSILKQCSTSRGLRLYSDLLTASLETKFQEAKKLAAEKGTKFDEKKFANDYFAKHLERKSEEK